MALEITWPRAQGSTSLPRTIVACGLADESVVDVVGECRSISEPSASIQCTVVFFALVESPEKESLQYRWSIFVKTPGPGEYVLTVTGLRADGKSRPEEASVSFKVEQSSVLTRAGLGLANILYPVSNQDITLEASNLNANGDLFDYPLAVLEFKDSSGNLIGPVYQYSDWLTLQYWMAIYPPLGPGVYSLHVEDTHGNGATATGLYVGP